MRTFGEPPNRRARMAWSRGETARALQATIDSTRRQQKRETAELGEAIAGRLLANTASIAIAVSSPAEPSSTPLP